LKHDKGQWRKKLLVIMTTNLAIWPFIMYGLLQRIPPAEATCVNVLTDEESPATRCDGYPRYYLPIGASWILTLISLVHAPSLYWVCVTYTVLVTTGISGFLFQNSLYQRHFLLTVVMFVGYQLWFVKTVWQGKRVVQSDMHAHRKAYKSIMEAHEPHVNQAAIDQLKSISDRVNRWGEVERRNERTTAYWCRYAVGLENKMIGKKVRQITSNMDELMDLATEVNYHFQDLVMAWCPPGTFHIPGPVKRPLRSMQKATRRYRRDLACLTDLVRCTIVCNDITKAAQVLKVIVAKCSSDDKPQSTKYAAARSGMEDDIILRVHKIKNRFDPEYDDTTTAGYRDIALQVEVGWIVGKDGMCWFVPVSHWKSDVRVDRLVCEVQIQVKDCVHRGQASDEQHTRYIKFRDWMGK